MVAVAVVLSPHWSAGMDDAMINVEKLESAAGSSNLAVKSERHCWDDARRKLDHLVGLQQMNSQLFHSLLVVYLKTYITSEMASDDSEEAEAVEMMFAKLIRSVLCVDKLNETDMEVRAKGAVEDPMLVMKLLKQLGDLYRLKLLRILLDAQEQSLKVRHRESAKRILERVVTVCADAGDNETLLTLLRCCFVITKESIHRTEDIEVSRLFNCAQRFETQKVVAEKLRITEALRGCLLRCLLFVSLSAHTITVYGSIHHAKNLQLGEPQREQLLSWLRIFFCFLEMIQKQLTSEPLTGADETVKEVLHQQMLRSELVKLTNEALWSFYTMITSSELSLF